MQSYEGKKKVIIDVLIAALLTAVFAIIAYLLYSYTYGVNDDAFIGSVLMGSLTGSPDAHVVYIKYPLASVLVFLFKIFPAVNWHYALLIACFIICVFLVNFRIFSNIKKWINKFIFSVIFMLCFWFCLAKQITMIHYSMCAGVLTGTAIFWFITIKHESSKLNLALNYITALLLLFTAYGLRSRTVFMLMPLAAVALIYKLIKAKPIFTKKNIIRWIIFPVVLFVGIGGIEVLHNANYKSDAWQEFLKFNDARTTIYDFYGLPEYEENKELYNDLGVDKTRQYMYEQYYLEFTDGTSNDMLGSVASYQVKKVKKALPFGKRIAKTIKELPKNLFAKEYQPISIFVICLFVALIVLSIIFKKNRTLLFLILAFIATLIPWGYMIYMNKPVSRVTYGIWVANLVTMIGLLIDNSDEIRKMLSKVREIKFANYTKIIVSVVIALALLLGIGLNYKKVQKYVNNSIKSGQVRIALENWCKENPENLYIYETQTFNTIGYDMKSMKGKFSNIVWPGGWCAKMANLESIWPKLGIDNLEKDIAQKDNIYLVSYSDIDMSYWENFYQANYKKGNLTKVDEKTFEGINFSIYSLSK